MQVGENAVLLRPSDESGCVDRHRSAGLKSQSQLFARDDHAAIGAADTLPLVTLSARRFRACPGPPRPVRTRSG